MKEQPMAKNQSTKKNSNSQSTSKSSELPKRARARYAVLEVLSRIEKNGPPLPVRLNRVFESLRLNEQDRALATEWCNGVLRQRSTLEAWLGSLYQGPLTRLRPDFRWHLLMGLYGLKFLDRVPAYAVVYEAVEMARSKFGEGAARLTNALLRSAQQTEPPAVTADSISDKLATEFSHPVWLVKRWLSFLGEEKTRALLEWNQSPSPLWVRVNRLKIEPSQFIQLLINDGIEVTQSELMEEFVQLVGRVKLRGWKYLLEGYCTVQDLGSGLPVLVLDPQPNERILDLCSAPGGKTTQMAERMENRGKIIAIDISDKRLALVREGITRLGLNIIEPILYDGRNYTDSEPFDAILADVPCSGTGVMASRADLRWRRQESDMTELIQLQSELLDNATKLLKPGGRLVYSTCSLEPDENEEQVNQFLKRHPEFYLETGNDKLPSLRIDEGMWKSWPPRDHFGGTFIARLIKRL